MDCNKKSELTIQNQTIMKITDLENIIPRRDLRENLRFYVLLLQMEELEAGGEARGEATGLG